MSDPVRVNRTVLPITNVSRAGFTTYGAKDPEPRYPPIRDLRPPGRGAEEEVVMEAEKVPAPASYVTKTPDYKPGAKSGKRDELTMFYRVKPGHEKEIRKAIENFFADSGRTNMDDPRIFRYIAQTGVHDIRLALFDNDTRLVWLTSFDTEWDPYIDDTFAVRHNLVEYGKILQHTIEAPDGVADPNSPIQQNSRGVKDLFLAQRVMAVGYAPTFPNGTTWGIRKGEKLLEAFNKVLDHPNAEEALTHPALKPLLDLASE